MESDDMSIDEAIAKYKEITNTDANCPAHCNISCDKCVQESRQLAEWLEELKQYKDTLLTPQMIEELKKSEKQAHKTAIQNAMLVEDSYNNAIDDFMKKVELKFLGVHPDELCDKYYPMDICKQIKEIAEQLKAGGTE